jgi:WD40 repeat protein
MDVFEIVVQRKAGAGWPVVAEYNRSGEFLSNTRREGVLQLDEAAYIALQQTEIDPLAYGTVLGQALFRENLRDAFMQARAQSPGHLRVLLVIEDPNLRPLHWESLCAPIGVGGGWRHLALDQRLLFSLYLPSLTDRRFPAIGRRDLRALVLVANPAENDRSSLPYFDGAATVAGVREALGEIPVQVLANVEGADGQPTLNELCDRITAEHYTILHIVAHGWYRNSDGETILYLLDENSEVSPIPTSRLIERLDQLQGARGLPHLAFLSTCESAAPEAEREGALGGLAQRLVRELGMPAVVAMTKRVSVATATALAGRFYARLREHGEVARALVEAGVELADAGDITVPALYERLGGRPLFSDSIDRELTDSEVEAGLAALEQLLPERAPILQATFAKHAATVRGLLGADRSALSKEAQEEWEQSLDEVISLCEETLDLSFRGLALGQQPPPYDSRPPFPGLAAFQPDEEEFFFGREALVETLVERLKTQRFLALLGPSGSGKSSVALAGLVPALRRTRPDLQLAYLTPGGNPVAQLATSLARLQPGLPGLVLVDQFEELFTLVDNEDWRRAFVGRLLELPDQVPVVITMRADFWGECAAYPALKDAMQSHQELIGPMNTAELRSAMEQQAAAVGLRFEADLGNTILDAVKEEPGAMPLLQHALLELWHRRHGRWLRSSEYRKIGGVQRAIGETADKIYEQVSEPEQAHMRDIFVRLTRLGEGSASEERRDTRHRVQFEELVPAGGDPAVTRRLVQRLADVRLVVTSVNESTGQEQVEVAHEALIRYWPRLRGWLDEDRDLLRLREGIRQAAREWQDRPEESREHMLIHRGSRLEEIEAFMRVGRLALNEQEQAYVAACVDLRDREARQREEQRQRELKLAQERAAEAEARQQAEEEARCQADQRAEEQARAAAILRKRALMLAGVMILALITAIAAGVFWKQSVEKEKEAVAAEATAVAEKERAEAQARLALSRDLAAQSDQQFDLASYDLSLLLAIESLRVDETAAARTALHQAMTAPVDALQIFAHDDFVQEATWNGDESRVLTASYDGTARVWDAWSGEELLRLDHGTGVVLARWNTDESRILTADWDGIVHVWDAASGQELLSLPGYESITEARWNRDGSRILTASEDFAARVWDAVTGEELLVLPHEGEVEAAIWNQNESRILTIDLAGRARVWDATSGEELLTLVHGFGVNQAIWADGESMVITASGDGVHFYDAETGEELVRLPHDSAVTYVSWQEDEGLLMTSTDEGTVFVWDPAAVQAEAEQYSQGAGGEGGDVFVWDPATSPPRLTLRHGAWVNEAAWSGSGQFIVTASDDSTARVWDTASGNQLLTLGHGDWVNHATWSADGNRVLTASDDGTARIWMRTKGVELLTLPAVDQARWNQDGSRILTVRWDGLAQSWDATSGEELFAFPRGEDEFEGNAMWSNDGSRVLTAACEKEGQFDARTWYRLVNEALGGERSLDTYGVYPYEPFMGESAKFSGQSWQLTPEGSEYYRLTNQFLGKEWALAVSEDGENRLLMADTGGRQAQNWKLVAVDGEAYRLTNQALGAGWSLGVTGYGADVLLMEETADSSSQYWYLIPGESDCVRHTVRVWDANTGDELATLAHPAELEQMTWDGDGKRILTISSDNTVHVWDATSGAELTALPHNGRAFGAIWSPDSSRLLTADCEVSDPEGGCESGVARIWDAETGQVLLSLEPQDGFDSALWSPDGSVILTARYPGMAYGWDAATGKELFAIETWIDSEYDGFSSDGSHLILGDSVYDTTSGTKLMQINHSGETLAKNLNKDGSLVLSSGSDRRARLWDTASGDPVRSLSQELAVYDAIWNSDESLILTSSEDRTARVWDAATGQLLSILPNSRPVLWAGWSPDERTILTVNKDRAVTLYYADVGDLLAAACGRALRNMTQEQWEQFMGDEPYRLTCPEVETRAARVPPVPSAQPSTDAVANQPTATPVPAPTAVPTEASEGPSPSMDLLSFEDEAGVFSISYPASLDQIEAGAGEGTDYGTTFSAADGSAAIGVLFRPLDGPLTDAEWETFAGAYAEIDSLDAELGLGPNAVELDRWSGEPGEHTICLEFESEESHGLSCIEEAGGALAVVLWVTAVDVWPEMGEAMVESLSSFDWSPEAVGDQLAPEPTPVAAQVTAEETPLSTPTAAAARLSGRIVFPVFDASKSVGGQAGGYDIWISDPQGSNRQLLVANASQPHLNADGDLLAYRSWEPRERGIAILGLDGGGSELLTGFIEDGLPSWAPDSSSIAFASRREGDRAPRLYRLNQEDGEERWLGVLAQYVSTLPDGRLTFKGCTADTTTCGMFTTGPNGGPLTLLSDNPSDTAPAPSPDGRQIAFMSFEREGAGNWEIYVVSSSGGKVTRLTDNSANDGLPAWSPDGRTIAFASNRDGAWAIWAMNPDGGNQRKLFPMGGSPDGVVGFDASNSFGWSEERIWWAP